MSRSSRSVAGLAGHPPHRARPWPSACLRGDLEKLLEKADPRWAAEVHELLHKHRLSSRAEYFDSGPNVKALILQRFRHQIRDGAISFLFARDGLEALAALQASGGIGLVVTDINTPRMDGL
jgi:CheY-like chemotaxis protein